MRPRGSHSRDIAVRITRGIRILLTARLYSRLVIRKAATKKMAPMTFLPTM